MGKVLYIIITILSFNSFSGEVCLTGSTVKQFPKYGDAFVNGAKLALKNSNVEVKKYFYDRGPESAYRTYVQMVKDGCKVIVGFSTGNDLISINEITKKLKVPVISIYGDNSYVLKKNKYILTLQPEPEYLIDALVPIIKKKKIKRVLLITAIDRGAMLLYKRAYKKILDKNDINYKEVDLLETTQNLSKVRNVLSHKYKFDSVILLTRSSLGAKITDLITSEIQEVTVFGTKYMGSSALPAYLNYLSNKSINAYFVRHNCLCDKNVEYSSFVKRYKKEFEVSPMVISAKSYDAVNFYIKSKKEKKTMNSFMNLSNSEFKGLSGVKISKGFKVDFFKKFVINITDKGYKEK